MLCPWEWGLYNPLTALVCLLSSSSVHHKHLFMWWTFLSHTAFTFPLVHLESRHLLTVSAAPWPRILISLNRRLLSQLSCFSLSPAQVWALKRAPQKWIVIYSRVSWLHTLSIIIVLASTWPDICWRSAWTEAPSYPSDTSLCFARIPISL